VIARPGLPPPMLKPWSGTDPGHVPSSELLSCQASFVEVGDHLPIDDVGELTLEAPVFRSLTRPLVILR